MLWVIHHWLIPVIGFVAWFGMLWAMLIYWFVNGRPQYPWQNGSIAFISDIGATSTMQPVFIAFTCVMGLCLVLSVASDRLLRHQSRLPRNMRQTERILSYLAITGAIIGAVGIILVSCFNTNRFQIVHDSCLLVFILGVALSAIFTTAEYRYLDVHHHDHIRIHGLLKTSYIFKIVIVSLDIALAVAFAVTLFVSNRNNNNKIHNVAAILEWLIAFVYTFYLLSFAMDLYPAARAEKGDFAVENGYDVEGFPFHHEHGRGHAHADSDGASNITAATAAGVPPTSHVVEVGHTGGATAIGTGQDARRMEMSERDGPRDARNPHAFATRHADDHGRPQRPL